METEKLASMVEVFEGLEDWRRAADAACAERTADGGGVRGAERRRRFRGSLAMGRERLDWLRGFLTLDYGVPLRTPSSGSLRCSTQRASRGRFGVG
jgi:hypothetical protein